MRTHNTHNTQARARAHTHTHTHTTQHLAAGARGQDKQKNIRVGLVEIFNHTGADVRGGGADEFVILVTILQESVPYYAGPARHIKLACPVSQLLPFSLLPCSPAPLCTLPGSRAAACVCAYVCVCVCVCARVRVRAARVAPPFLAQRHAETERERDTDGPERAQARAQTQAEGHLNHLRVNEDAVASLLEFGENTVEDIELTADAHPHLRAQVPLFFQKKKERLFQNAVQRAVCTSECSASVKAVLRFRHILHACILHNF